jgi:Fur family ferric uptake transcriptional regulator
MVVNIAIWFVRSGGRTIVVDIVHVTRGPREPTPYRFAGAPLMTSQPTGRGTRVRGTRQAEALNAALADLPAFTSAQDIHAELRRRGERIGLTTVYRQLQVLAEAGAVDAIRDHSGETLYRRCETSTHHHHVTCRTCGHSVEVEGRAVERWADQVAAEAGYVDIDHTVEIFGLCPTCAHNRH